MADKSNEFTKLALRHPVGWAAATGALLTAVGLAGGLGVFAIAVGLLFGGVQWTLWRDGGWAARREEKHVKGPLNRKRLWLNLAFMLLVAGLTFVTIAVVAS